VAQSSSQLQSSIISQGSFAAHVVARTISCKNVVLRGCGKLRGVISYFLTTRSSQVNVEAASNVDRNIS